MAAATAPLLGRTGYRPDIDGLRALSIVLVVAFHAGIPGFTGGYVGVDVFFVLSGFLITGLLLKEHARTGTISLRDFYARRARRLLPLSALVLVSTVTAGGALLGPLARAQLVQDARAAALYLANWRFAAQATEYSDAEVTDTLLLHYWSLSVEEQFYFLWPILILAALRFAARRGHPPLRAAGCVLGIVLVTSFVASLVQTATLGVGAYYVTQTRLWEMAAGAALAVGLAQRDGALRRVPADLLGSMGLLAIISAGLVYDTQTAFPGSAALVPVLGTLALIVAGRSPESEVARLLSRRPFPLVGRWSYAWYLWHWPVLGVTHLVNDSSTQPLSRHWATLGAIVLSLGLAAASHYLVENPVRHARAFSRVPSRGLALGVTLTLIPVMGSGLLLLTWGAGEESMTVPDETIPASAESADAATERRGIPAMSPAVAAEDHITIAPHCNGDYRSDQLGEDCSFGDDDADTTILLTGDSHAQHWLPALVAATEQHDLRVITWTMSSCPISSVPVYENRTEGRYLNCERWRERLLDRIGRDGADIDVVLIGRSYGYQNLVVEDDGERVEDSDRVRERWRHGSQESFARIAAAGPRIVLIADTPWAAEPVPDCLAESRSPTDCDFALEEAAERDALLLQAERASGVDAFDVIDLTRDVCPADPCSTVLPGGVIIFRDAHHLTQTYSTLLSEALIDRLQAVGVAL